jgi:hypothetical protein
VQRVTHVKRITMVLVVAACGCSSSSSPHAGSVTDASTDATTGPTKDAEAPVDSSLPESSTPEAGGADAADDAGAEEAGCGWDGSVESPACSACLRSMCCGVTTTCEGDPACVALDSCVNACATSSQADDGGVANCDQDCALQQTAAVQDEYRVWTQCIGSLCGGSSGDGPCL